MILCFALIFGDLFGFVVIGCDVLFCFVRHCVILSDSVWFRVTSSNTCSINSSSSGSWSGSSSSNISSKTV